MAFFKRRRKRRRMADSETLLETKEIFHHIQALTIEPALRFILEKRHPALWESKLGGLPYLPDGETPPADSQGRQLRLLAQICCQDLSDLPDFPHEGLLQFFVLDDDMTGLEMSDLTRQDTFRIVYYPVFDKLITEEDVASRISPYIEEEGAFPVDGCYGLKFRTAPEGLSAEDYRFDHLFVKEFNKEFPDAKAHTLLDLDDELTDYIYESSKGTGHKAGGYPFFTQDDPRDSDRSLRDLDTLLLQIDSDFDEDEDRILWGDGGVCNFFISREALKQKDFSRVAYNWDCY